VNTSDNIISGFDSFDLRSDALAETRSKAIESFQKSGFPNTSNEEWKYTSVKEIADKLNKPHRATPESRLRPSDIEQLLLAGNDVTLLVFENGLFQESLSTNLPSDFTIKTLATVRNDAAVKQHLGKIASSESESFVALNTAFVNDGVFIHIPARKSIEKPVHILYVSTQESPAITRNLVIAEPESAIQIVESYHSLGNTTEGLTTNVTEVLVKRNANVTWVKAQLENELTSQISFTQVEQEQDSRQDAQKTNAYQSNKNILLSDDAQMNTKPQLEIFADDVKCSHGTTTGQLDDEALFYLRARGIGEQSARTLLNIAFAADVLDHIELETLRQNLQSIAEEKLMRS